MQHVFLMPYDPRWPGEFAVEASLVTGAMGNLLVEIHPIGSTAVPGLAAKPIIDLLAAVSDVSLLDEKTATMGALGYEAMGEFGMPGRRYFRKDDQNGCRIHQVHAFHAGSPQIARHLAFRDFMRAHPEFASQYEALKRNRLADQYPHDIGSYTNGKDDFIQEMDVKAAAWQKARAAASR